jgi:hypothetical protein
MKRRTSIHIGLDKRTQEIISEIPHNYRSAIIRGLLRAYKVYADKNSNKLSNCFTVMDDLVEIKKIEEGSNVTR